MQRTLLGIAITVAMIVAASATTALADTVTCLSDVCNVAPTDRIYYYGVTAAAAGTLTTLEIATDDGNIANYTQWIEPAGWDHQIIKNNDLLKDLPYTQHGLITDWDTPSAYRIVWTGPALTTNLTYFGFNNPNAPEDAAWVTNSPSQANWSQPVAMGEGPVHAPVPEPMTLATLTLGALAILRRRTA